MAAATAGFTSLSRGFLPSKDEFGLIDKLGEHISHREGEGDEDQYFLNKFHTFFS